MTVKAISTTQKVTNLSLIDPFFNLFANLFRVLVLHHCPVFDHLHNTQMEGIEAEKASSLY